MQNRNDPNLLDWLEHLNEVGIPPMSGSPDISGFQPPASQPGMPGDPMGSGDQQMQPDQMQGADDQIDDLSDDPEYPDYPEEDQEDIYDDFELWREKYIKESIKGDPNQLLDLINGIRDQELEPNPRKFVEDNLEICFLRQNPIVYQPSSKVRKNLKQDVDRNLPSTSIVRHVCAELEQVPVINDIFIKLLGTGGGKQDLHRKFLGALLGAVQVGSGANSEDLIFEETEYSIQISTRFNTKWGDVMLGSWSLKEDDPDRFLKDAELERLQGGSPEERDVIRRRVVIESIADQFKQRAFFITTVANDGTIHHLGIDLGNCLDSGFIDGRLVVRSKNSDTRQAFIDDDGNVVAIPDLTIFYVREVDDGMGGDRTTEEIEFIRHRDGNLFLSAQADLLIEASSTLQGVIFKEIPWRGNPTDFIHISRCAPAADEILLRRCP